MSRPTSFEELGVDALEAVDELLDRANHDVAKYMAMTARNVDPEDLGSEELAMLRADLWETDGSRTAWELWRGFSNQIAELATPPNLPPMMVTGLSGFKDTLTLSTSFYESAIPREKFEELFDLVEEELGDSPARG